MGAAPAASPPTLSLYPDERVVVRRVSWETYEQLMADDTERRIPRITYDQGVLELVTPSLPHEKDAQTITLFVEIVAATLDIPSVGAGGTTYRREDLERGFEPDASFYIQHEEVVRDRTAINLSIDPPPDVVLEMEVSRSAMNKLRLFASMGVPEVWRCDGERVTIFLRDGDTYRESLRSTALPVVTGEVLTRFLAQSRTMRRPAWFQAVSDWSREQRAAGRQ